MPDALVTGSLHSFASVVDDAALQFEQAWEAAGTSTVPDVGAFLPDESTARVRVALRLSQIDIERRTAAGQEPRAETYLERFPELAADPDDVLALAVTEAEARLRHGRSIDPDDYRRRFPANVDRLIARLLHRSLPRVPGYEVEGELGRGAMGVVYKARQVKLNRTVALKVVTAPDRQSITRFLLEAEAVAAVRHPNVIQVFDSGEYDGLPYLAMEHLDGGTLQAALKRVSVLAPNETAELVAQLADGVQAVHEAGTVHRDLKPANVLFDAAGIPKVADFGLAMRGGVELTQTQGRFLGTPAYAAPEQAAGMREFVGPPADVWSLGIILYECLTGQRPFGGGDALSVLNKVRTETPLAPRAVNRSIPRDLELICLKCLEKYPADRYQTAAELAYDLTRFLAGRPVSARPVSVLARIVKTVRRNPVFAGLVFVFFLGCSISTAASLIAWKNARARADAESARAGEQSARVDAERDAAASAKKQLEAERAATASANKLLEAEREGTAEKERRGRAEREAAVAAAAQANDLQRIVDVVEAAERDKLVVPPELRLAAAAALSSLGRSDDSRKRLADLVAAPDLPPDLRARVELRFADELLGVDDERAQKFLASSRASGKLPPADLAYADGLIAVRMPDAIAQFQLALRHDPTHFPARRLLGMYLAVSGRLDEAIQVGEGSRLLTRNHPDILFPLLLAHGYKGNAREALDLFKLLRPHLSPELDEQLHAVARLMPLLNAEFKAAMDGKPPPLPPDIFDLKGFVAKAAKEGAVEPLEELYKATGKQFMRMPPSFRDALSDYWEFCITHAQFGRDYCTELSGDEVRLARLKANLDRRPEGFMRFLYAFSLTCRANGYGIHHGNKGGHGGRLREMYRTTADAYVVAADTPGMLDVRAIALEGAALHYALAGKPSWAEHADADALAKAGEMVRRRLALEEPVTGRRYILVLVARKVSDFTSARRLLDDWEKESPSDFQMLGLRAEVELLAGAHSAALTAARKVLAKEPTHAGMRKIEADCLEKMRYDPQRIAPPPRPR